jgi:ribose 5-phosphate isomerase A
MTRDEAKRLAARAALEFLPEEGVVGLGSGSTAEMFIDEVGKLVEAGRRLRGVPTSEASRRRAAGLGIELLGDAGPWSIHVTVDGADEVSAELDLIKGGGACHAREKIVNQASQKNVIVVDDSKLSKCLGEKWPVPVEVLVFGHETTAASLEKLGRTELRKKDGKVVLTDANNYIYDLHAGALEAPEELEGRLVRIPGVVATGLFLRRADVVLVAGEAGVRRLEK